MLGFQGRNKYERKYKQLLNDFLIQSIYLNRMKENLSEYIPRKIVQETIFNPRYRSIDKIGSGSFGEIHKVYDTIDKKLRAEKIEKKDKRGAQGMLLKEAYIMK